VSIRYKIIIIVIIDVFNIIIIIIIINIIISNGPIYHQAFYDGPWDSLKFFDYVVYPMNYFFSTNTNTNSSNSTNNLLDGIDADCDDECLKNYNITLSLGRQDREGWVCTINVYDLLKTMIPV
jgi:hypothetical protein